MTERRKIFRGDRLRLVRERLGLTQDDVVGRLGLGNTQLHRYETGKAEPSPEVLVRLATELEITTDYLLGLVNDPTGHIEEQDLTPDERKLIAAFRRKDLRDIMLLIAKKPDN